MVWAECCRVQRHTECVVGNVERISGGGASSVDGVCRRHLRCSDTSVSSTTGQRRTEGDRTKRSSPRPTLPCVDCGRSTPTWSSSFRDTRGMRRRRWTWDATLIETHKKEALYCYKKHQAYQPLTTYWAEADQIVHSEFRDGNVPAGHQQLRVLGESLQYLPDGVEAGDDEIGHRRLPEGTAEVLC